MQYDNVLNIVREIDAVGLDEAYVSIESEHVSDLIDFLNEWNIAAKTTYWNAPQSLYVGSNTPTENLAVLSLRW